MYNLFQPMSIFILFFLQLQLRKFITFYGSFQLKSSTPFTCFPSFALLLLLLFWWSCIITRNVHKTFPFLERCAFIFLLKCHRFLLKFVNSKEKFSFHTYVTSWMKPIQRSFQHAFPWLFSVLFIYIHCFIAEPGTKQWNEAMKYLKALFKHQQF